MEDSKNSIEPENEGKGVAIDDKTTVVVATPEADKLNSRLLASTKRLIESKSIKAEKTKTDLIKTKSINEIDLNTLLTKDDQLFYDEKKNIYLDKYPELEDDPFDMDDLHLMIMEQIQQRNLLKKKKKRPALDISKQYEASVKRQNDLKKNLSLRRTDRVKNKDTKKTQVNIAQLSVGFNDPDRLAEFTDRAAQLREEESRLGITGTEKAFE